MKARKTVSLFAVPLVAGLFATAENAIARNGGSQTHSAPQQKSVRQSANIHVPNKPATSRKLQKRDATAVKTPATRQLQQDFSKARKEAEQKTADDLKKKKQDEAKKLNETGGDIQGQEGAKDAAAGAASPGRKSQRDEADAENKANQARKDAARGERDEQQRAARVRGKGGTFVPKMPENAATRSHPCVDCAR